MSEPDYLRQTADFAERTLDQRRQWFDHVCREAHDTKGCTWVRMSVDNHEAPTMALVEGWKTRPADEGELRWQLTHAK